MNYPLPILNELHEYYPDILYNPSRFQSGVDIINYIIEQGIHQPYQREFTRYQEEQQQRHHHEQLQESITRVQHTQAQQQDMVIAELEREMYGSVPVPAPSENIPISSSALEQMLTIIFESSLSNPRPRYAQSMRAPTLEQLSRSTTIHTLTENQDGVCAICHDGMIIGQHVRQIHQCGHMFHQFCIDTWFSINGTCPTCRHDVRT